MTLKQISLALVAVTLALSSTARAVTITEASGNLQTFAFDVNNSELTKIGRAHV